MNEQIMRKSRWKSILILLFIIVLTYLSSAITSFNFIEGMVTIPRAMSWIFTNLMVTQESLERLPKILEKLSGNDLYVHCGNNVCGCYFSIFRGIWIKTTKVNNFLSVFARFIASVSRNIPVVAWSLILLISFGQNSVTGFLALFVGTIGFLTRAFIESIDEASQSSVEALTATGATYFQIVGKSVIPQCLPQMVSWILFMVETNIRNATLVGILTGTGIGYSFDMYYKLLNYNAVALVTLCIVITVIIVDLISNYIRKVIL